MGKYKGSGKILKQAYSKYGVENFSIEILKSRIPSEEVNEREKEYIAAERAFGKAQYNIQKGGQGGWILDFNKKDSEEYKKWHEQMLKMNRSEERRKKLSEARKKFLEEHPESRELQSLKMKEFYKNHPEKRKEMSEKIKNLPGKRERAEKSAKINKQRYQNPEERLRLSKITTKAWQNEETRNKMANGIKKAHERKRQILRKAMDYLGLEPSYEKSFRKINSHIKYNKNIDENATISQCVENWKEFCKGNEVC